MSEPSFRRASDQPELLERNELVHLLYVYRATMTGEKTFKNPFASGLGRSGRLAAWVVAIGAVAAYNYYESSKVGEFTKDEQEAWNKQKKEASSKSK